ncbi:MAG: hypothetical protein A3B96_03290 [Candidatus Spechtbacteria bacterium RIFCSPHIGHO2_02_FULL_43_15b]|uniref:DUF58 domain-containing protein n=1 Tax=Candidatus Spechtbacteria bacterium RIFCSPHIGHO2_01_FULL_43_30 TaxID=1802158 RepID=A0A1G2H8B8_9BACT|nr:MAG: hypothetical protein A2827_00355 [Candidatus Spechtbacteria bacterium RIFCSPHIGHO2_01_FULL_43_30]OGZ59766.1 MAG: hypothetical protein A3B96_03290 [Candidatus Spechtbacteria bacterium RIFCSPHIGHO2_02_FULL_43_15b]
MSKTHIKARVFNRLGFEPRQKTNSRVSGQFQSRLIGSGQEFYSLREYTPGDDSRKIYWHHFAKTGNLMTREDIAETNLRIWLVVESSSSMNFGQKPQSIGVFFEFIKWLALGGPNSLGFIFFGDKIDFFAKPVMGQIATRQLSTLADSFPGTAQNKIADIKLPSSLLLKHGRNGDIVFFVSDFLFADIKEVEKELRKISLYQELIPVVLRDPRERIPMKNFRLASADMETSKVIELSNNDELSRFDSELKETFNSLGVENLWIETESDHATLTTIIGWLSNRGKVRLR